MSSDPHPPKPLYFTFGNHMHWVDMQWLWGYQVLPDSIRDMLALCDDVGAKGNVNFDGVGYEKLAAEAPEALAALRAAVQAGRVEVVGATYGQPYGLFHGGESNVRQLVYGARTVRRLLGVWPRAFWEEEFYFFPQLPQMLDKAGFETASLFFQWTWHTPTVPEERVPLVLWEGIDGTRLPALAKTELCLHQWPEDLEGRLESEMIRELERPALVQWLELMPSPDWMCRSEVLLPRLRELFADPRFELRPVTLSELAAELDDGDLPVRRYTMDDVFHGMSLGKNGDELRRRSREGEGTLLAAEAAATLAGLTGRPYASWGVYPTWELEEAWRELLQAQHHDNDECEGLCGFVGKESYERSRRLAENVLERTLDHLAARAGDSIVFNPLGWARQIPEEDDVPPFGYRVRPGWKDRWRSWNRDFCCEHAVEVRESEGTIELALRDLRVTIDRVHGRIQQITSTEFPEGLLGARLLDFVMTEDGQDECFDAREVKVVRGDDGEFFGVKMTYVGVTGFAHVNLELLDAPLRVQIHLEARTDRPDARMHAGLRMPIVPSFETGPLRHDTPYAVSEIRAERDHVRKYPTGDWMTSPQVFETIERPFTALSFVGLDALDGQRGMTWVHGGNQGFLRTERGIVQLFNTYDAWDETWWRDEFYASVWIVPHGPLTDAARWRVAQECRRPLLCGDPTGPRFAGGGALPTEPGLPDAFGALHVVPDHVVATALFRESERTAEYLDSAFAADAESPVVVRLVELEGRSATATISVPGPVAAAARTDLLGAVLEPLEPVPCPAPFGPPDVAWHVILIEIGAHEIATVQLDLELARHAPRHLDRHRGVWARIHRSSERDEQGGSTER